MSFLNLIAGSAKDDDGSFLGLFNSNQQTTELYQNLVIQIYDTIMITFPWIDIYYGIIVPLGGTIIIVTIIRIIVYYIQLILYLPTLYEMHMDAIVLLVKNHSTSSSSSSSSISKNSQRNHLQQQEVTVPMTTNKTMKKKKQQRKKLKKIIPLLWDSIMNYTTATTNNNHKRYNYNSQEEQRGIVLLQKAADSVYYPAIISLAAYYTYRLQKPIDAFELLERYNLLVESRQNKQPFTIKSKEGNYVLNSRDNNDIIINDEGDEQDNTNNSTSTSTTTNTNTNNNNNDTNNKNKTNHNDEDKDKDDKGYCNSYSTSTENIDPLIVHAARNIAFDAQLILSGQHSMIQTLLREDEYLSIQYVLEWKQLELEKQKQKQKQKQKENLIMKENIFGTSYVTARSRNQHLVTENKKIQ